MCRGLTFLTVGRVILSFLTHTRSLHSEWQHGETSREHFRQKPTLTTFTGHSWHVTRHLLLFASNFACMYVHVFVSSVWVMHHFIVAFIHSFYIGTWQDFIQIDVRPKGSGGVLLFSYSDASSWAMHHEFPLNCSITQNCHSLKPEESRVFFWFIKGTDGYLKIRLLCLENLRSVSVRVKSAHCGDFRLNVS